MPRPVPTPPQGPGAACRACPSTCPSCQGAGQGGRVSQRGPGGAPRPGHPGMEAPAGPEGLGTRPGAARAGEARRGAGVDQAPGEDCSALAQRQGLQVPGHGVPAAHGACVCSGRPAARTGLPCAQVTLPRPPPPAHPATPTHAAPSGVLLLPAHLHSAHPAPRTASPFTLGLCHPLPLPHTPAILAPPAPPTPEPHAPPSGSGLVPRIGGSGFLNTPTLISQVRSA